MTRDEAEGECRRVAAEHPDRATHRWFPQERPDGSWVVVKAPVAAGTRIDPLGEETRADEKPPTPDDPRTSLEQNVGGNYGM